MASTVSTAVSSTPGLTISREETFSCKPPHCAETNCEHLDYNCSICFELLKENVVTEPQGGHSFHRACIERWIKTDKEGDSEALQVKPCPVCRGWVTKATLVENTVIPRLIQDEVSCSDLQKNGGTRSLLPESLQGITLPAKAKGEFVNKLPPIRVNGQLAWTALTLLGQMISNIFYLIFLVCADIFTLTLFEDRIWTEIGRVKNAHKSLSDEVDMLVQRTFSS